MTIIEEIANIIWHLQHSQKAYLTLRPNYDLLYMTIQRCQEKALADDVESIADEMYRLQRQQKEKANAE